MTTSASPERWLQEHGDALYRFALIQVRNTHQAEELVQVTLLAALESCDRFSGQSSVRTWLIGILKHKVLDHFRRESRIEYNDWIEEEHDAHDNASEFAANGHWQTPVADWGNPEQLQENQEFWIFLQRCLEQLPSHLARIYFLRELMEASTEEICKELSVSATNLWTSLHRARTGLRKCLGNAWAPS